jgi:hypothetical protein
MQQVDEFERWTERGKSQKVTYCVISTTQCRTSDNHENRGEALVAGAMAGQNI